MRILPLTILVGLVVGALYLPIQVPYDIRSIGIVYPCREWKLLKDEAGNLTSTLQDFQTGTITSAANYPFERGDLVRMQLHANPDSAGFIAANDTILDILTIRMDDQILELEGELSRSQAELMSGESGEKTPVIQEAENQLRYAEEDLRLKQRIFEIQKKLYEEGVIAQLEFQQAENTRDLAQIQVSVAQKTLDIARTGLKPEEVEIRRKRIAALENRIRFLRLQKGGYRLLAPFRGRVVASAIPTEMLVLQDTKEYIVQIPVPVEEAVWLGDHPAILVQDAVSRDTFSATFLNINSKVEVVGGRQVVFLQASTRSTHPLNTGLGAICTLRTGNLNPRQYLLRVLHWY